MAPASMVASVICTSTANSRTSEMCHCKWEYCQVASRVIRKSVCMEHATLPASQAFPVSAKEDGLDHSVINKLMTRVLEISMSFLKTEQ